MMSLSPCPNKRNNKYHSKPVDYYKRNRHQQSCVRNPLVIFSVSFLTLASLRFRVRTKQAAQHLIERGRQRISGNARMSRNVPQPAHTLALPEGRTIAYELVEGRTTNDNEDDDTKEVDPGLQRYRAVWVETNPQGQLATKSTVSVLEWAEHLLQSADTPQSSKQPSTQVSLLDQFIQILQSGNAYAAYFFETKGVTARNARTKPFEFVLKDTPQLQAFVQSAKNHDQVFANQFQSCDTPSCVFLNLGGDAVLVAPQPDTSNKNKKTSTSVQRYGHVTSFVRQAPYAQVRDFWITVLQVYTERLRLPTTPQHGERGRQSSTERHLNTTTAAKPSRLQQALAQAPRHRRYDVNTPVWLSTSGMGVAWVHMRLDETPKYYTYLPFAQEH